MLRVWKVDNTVAACFPNTDWLAQIASYGSSYSLFEKLTIRLTDVWTIIVAVQIHCDNAILRLVFRSWLTPTLIVFYYVYGDKACPRRLVAFGLDQDSECGLLLYFVHVFSILRRHGRLIRLEMFFALIVSGGKPSGTEEGEETSKK